MANESKKPVWISVQAHDTLREYCERTGRTQVDVVSELLYRYAKPEVEAHQAEGGKAS